MRLRERDRIGDEVLARMLRETDLTAQKETPFPALDRQTLKQNAACGFIDWVNAAARASKGAQRSRINVIGSGARPPPGWGISRSGQSQSAADPAGGCP